MYRGKCPHCGGSVLIEIGLVDPATVELPARAPATVRTGQWPPVVETKDGAVTRLRVEPPTTTYYDGGQGDPGDEQK